MVWESLAVMYTDTKFRYIEMIDNQIDTLGSEGKARSECLYYVEVDPINDKSLTLSTCTAKYGYVGGEARGRFVVMARLVDADQELKPTAGLEKNASIKAPQF